MKITLSLLFIALAFALVCLFRSESPTGVFHKEADKQRKAIAEAQALWNH